MFIDYSTLSLNFEDGTWNIEEGSFTIVWTDLIK
ncbi:hypothetical protein IWX84_000647 [Flavobacterium sp. CG_9.10]|nr:hypothetical protein [Flavobacterium sp. CG_9.10]